MLLHQTVSPRTNPRASSVTVPTRSRPTTNGKSMAVAYAPDRTNVSTWLTATAWTATETSSRPASGYGSRPVKILEAGPTASITAAGIVTGAGPGAGQPRARNA